MAIKVGLHDLPPVSFAAIRFVIAAGVLFWRVRSATHSGDWRPGAAITFSSLAPDS